MSLLLGVVLEFPNVAALLPAMLIFGASMSLFDVAINTEGSELESRQRPRDHEQPAWHVQRWRHGRRGA